MRQEATPTFRVSKLHQTMALMLADSAVVAPVSQAQTYNAPVNLADYHFFERDTAHTSDLLDVFAPILHSSNPLLYANVYIPVGTKHSWPLRLNSIKKKMYELTKQSNRSDNDAP